MIPVTQSDFPASLGNEMWHTMTNPPLFLYWAALVSIPCTGIVILLKGTAGYRGPVTVRSVARFVAFLIAAPLAVGSLCLLFTELVFLITWPFIWIIVWWPVYILAFFPQIGYFPPTNMSVFDMDQFAALLSIVVVATIRIWGPIFKAVRSRLSASTASSYEMSPLLPVSSGDTTGG
jgi:hypothetical protein